MLLYSIFLLLYAVTLTQTEHLSKRQSLSRKYSIRKKVAAHNKKIKRLAKLRPVRQCLLSPSLVIIFCTISDRTKEPPIPNDYPFKAQLIEDTQKLQQALLEERAQQSKRNQQGVPEEEFDEENGYVDEVIDDIKADLPRYRAPKLDFSKYKRFTTHINISSHMLSIVSS